MPVPVTVQTGSFRFRPSYLFLFVPPALIAVQHLPLGRAFQPDEGIFLGIEGFHQNGVKPAPVSPGDICKNLIPNGGNLPGGKPQPAGKFWTPRAVL